MMFYVEPYDACDKRVKIVGPDELLLEVDFDDVNHDEIEPRIHKIAQVLNDNWHTYPDGP